MNVEKLGIVILNYNTWQETKDCVNSIQRYTSLTYKIYIVDNKSTDDSVIKLKTIYHDRKDIVVIEAGENRGYSAGNNIGIRQAVIEKCSMIFVVNSDVEILNDAFTIMANTLRKRNSFMMVGPSVMNNNNEEAQIPRKKQTFRTFVLERHPFCKVPFLNQLSERQYPINKSKIFSFKGSVSGCCFGMRAKDFIEIGYLDENVFLYCEEDILAYKMEKKEKKSVVDMNARVWHKENISTKKEGGAFVQFHRWNSVLYLLKRYVGINKCLQFFVAVWNTATWFVISIISKEHRRMLKSFWVKNWRIVLKD